MDILGVGFPELMFIMIIAMMIFGPRRLPEMAAKAGKFVADLRNMSQGLMAEWQREITVAARLEEIEKARQELKEIEQELKQIPKDVSAETSAAKAVVEETIAPPRPASKATSTSTSVSTPAESQTTETAPPPAEPGAPEQPEPATANGTDEVTVPAAEPVVPPSSQPDSVAEGRSENGTLKSTLPPAEKPAPIESAAVPEAPAVDPEPAAEPETAEHPPDASPPPAQDDEASSAVSSYSKPKEVVNE